MLHQKAFGLIGIMCASFGLSSAANANGSYCREYTTQINIGGQMQDAYGQACQQPDGSWQRTTEPQPVPTLSQQNSGNYYPVSPAMQQAQPAMYYDYRQPQPQVIVKEVVRPTYYRPYHRSGSYFSISFGDDWRVKSYGRNHGRYHNSHSWNKHWKHHKKHYKHGRDRHHGHNRHR